MKQEFPHPPKPESAENLSLQEIAYVWPEKIRNQKYKEVIGQLPDTNLSEEEIAAAILDPEPERDRIWERNRKEDAEDARSNYPGGKKSS